MLTGGLVRGAHRVVLRGLAGLHDQREHHAQRGAAETAPGLGHGLVDRVGAGIGQVDRHRRPSLGSVARSLTG